MPSLVVIGPQIKEKQRGGGTIWLYCAPAYMVPKDPSLNRVKVEYLDNGLADFNDLGFILQDFGRPFR